MSLMIRCSSLPGQLLRPVPQGTESLLEHVDLRAAPVPEFRLGGVRDQFASIVEDKECERWGPRRRVEEIPQRPRPRHNDEVLRFRPLFADNRGDVSDDLVLNARGQIPGQEHFVEGVTESLTTLDPPGPNLGQQKQGPVSVLECRDLPGPLDRRPAIVAKDVVILTPH